MTLKIIEQTVRNLVFKCIRFNPRDFSVTGAGSNNLNVQLLRQGGSASRVRTEFPFMGYTVGTGLLVRLLPGSVRSDVPSNITIEIDVPPNITDGYWVWVRADRLGDTYAGGVTSEIQHGTTLPTPPESSGGLPPAWTFTPLFYVVTGAENIISIGQIVYTNLWIREDVTQSCGQTFFDLQWVYGDYAGGA